MHKFKYDILWKLFQKPWHDHLSLQVWPEVVGYVCVCERERVESSFIDMQKWHNNIDFQDFSKLLLLFEISIIT